MDVQRQGLTFHCYGYSGKMHDQLNYELLMKRGWVLQERLLSPRSIYFGSQLSWECTEVLANELFPEGMPYQRMPIWGLDTPYKLSRLLNIDPTIEENATYTRDSGGEDHDTFALYERWAQLVETYSVCELTFESDMLPAISGLAHRFAKSLGDVYLAGLWKGNICEGLLWEETGGMYNNTPGVHPRSYRGEYSDAFQYFSSFGRAY